MCTACMYVHVRTWRNAYIRVDRSGAKVWMPEVAKPSLRQPNHTEHGPTPRPPAQNLSSGSHFVREVLLSLVDAALSLLTTNPSSHRQDARHLRCQDVCRTLQCPPMRRVRNCDAVGPLRWIPRSQHSCLSPARRQKWPVRM